MSIEVFLHNFQSTICTSTLFKNHKFAKRETQFAVNITNPRSHETYMYIRFDILISSWQISIVIYPCAFTIWYIPFILYFGPINKPQIGGESSYEGRHFVVVFSCDIYKFFYQHVYLYKTHRDIVIL